jgi:hypothetical protein
MGDVRREVTYCMSAGGVRKRTGVGVVYAGHGVSIVLWCFVKRGGSLVSAHNTAKELLILYTCLLLLAWLTLDFIEMYIVWISFQSNTNPLINFHEVKVDYVPSHLQSTAEPSSLFARPD